MAELHRVVSVGDIKFANNLPLVLIGGVNVLESESFAVDVAGRYREICERFGIPLVFKGSYDKANRSSIHSYRGPGLEKGLRYLDAVKRTYHLPVITDVHVQEEAALAAEVCDIIQLPAFLARQTDLVQAMAKTNSAINIKKPQFLSPEQMAHVVEKFRSCGNERLLVCERGSSFGYDNLVVDMLGFGVMRKVTGGVPIVFDVTHALQRRNSGDKVSGGRRQQIFDLARAGVATGIAALFLESHPNPDEALCDGPSALPLNILEPFLAQVKLLDDMIKSQAVVEIS